MNNRPLILIASLLAVAPVSSGQGLYSEIYAQGFSLPLGFVQDKMDPSVQYILQQRGRIRTVINGVVQATDFLDLTGVVSTSGSERGLLGMAFAPSDDVRFFVNFTNTSGNTVVARFERSQANRLIANPASRFDFRWGSPAGLPYIVQPFSNHNGGHLAFGPDGYLYIGLGDGGSAGDPGHRAQDPNTWLGKMLRLNIDVPNNDPQGYSIPPDNPFLDGVPITALGEIWSFGLRNPWKYTFDNPMLGGTGAMVIADVGQNTWEEIDYEPAGRGERNYGWRNYEGNAVYNNTLPPAYTPLTFPIWVYDHSVGQSITGGYVYRGTRLITSGYHGRYFFADYVAGRVWSLKLTINPATGEATASDVREHTSELGGTATLGNISAFGEDLSGELYIVGYSNGRVFRIRGTDEDAVPSSYSLLRGIHVSGVLRDLYFSDDFRLVVQPGFTLNQTEHPIQLVFEGTMSYQSPSQLSFRLEASVDNPNIEQVMELYNFTTGDYEVLDTRIAAQSDTTAKVTITSNPSRFVEANTKRVRGRVKWKAVGLTLSYPFNARLDQLLVTGRRP